MKLYRLRCFALLLATTLIGCNSDSENQEITAMSTLQQITPDLQVIDDQLPTDSLVDEDTQSVASIINATNYMSLLRTGLDIAQYRITEFEGLIDLTDFATANGEITGNVSNQPCVAGGTYDLSLIVSDDPEIPKQNDIQAPIESYVFTACVSFSDTTISGFYELSEDHFEDFSYLQSSEKLDATITGLVTPDGPEDITIDGILGWSLDGANLGISFNLNNYIVVDATSTLEVVGSGQVDDMNNIELIVYDLDLTMKGSRINPENPSAPLTLRTEESQEGVTQSLQVMDGSLVSEGVVVLSAPDGSSVRAEASSNQDIANITLTGGGGLITSDSRPWSEIVP